MEQCARTYARANKNTDIIKKKKINNRVLATASQMETNEKETEQGTESKNETENNENKILDREIYWQIPNHSEKNMMENNENMHIKVPNISI